MTPTDAHVVTGAEATVGVGRPGKCRGDVPGVAATARVKGRAGSTVLFPLVRRLAHVQLAFDARQRSACADSGA